MIELAAEYEQLWKVADAMYRMLLDADLDFCDCVTSYGACPLCVARWRFAPEQLNYDSLLRISEAAIGKQAVARILAKAEAKKIPERP